MRIAIITDLHYSLAKNTACPMRTGEFACELLEAALEQLRHLNADVLLVGGDLVNVPNDVELLDALAGILDKSPCPYIAIPGNHDPMPETFYRHIQKAPEFLDISGIRILPFPEDTQTKGYNARRSEESLRRQELLSNGEFPCVSFQHVPLFPPGSMNVPYHYDNAEDIYARCGDRMALTISGHLHTGCRPLCKRQTSAVIAPAICEKSYPFALLDLNSNGHLLSYSLQYVCLTELMA